MILEARLVRRLTLFLLSGALLTVSGCGAGDSASSQPAAGTGGASTGGHASGGSTASGGASGGPVTPATAGVTGTGGLAAAATGGEGATSSGGATAGGVATGADSGAGVDAGTGTGGAEPRDAGLDSGPPREAGPPPTGKITVWMAGDSTMQPCQSPCPCGWGSQFQAYFGPNATVVDSAAGGRSIQTWLYDPNVTTMAGPDGECVISPKTYSTRWQAMLDGMKAGDYLFVEFGINDDDPTCAKSRHVGTALFQTYLEDMAAAAKMRGAQAIFLTSTSSMDCVGNMVNPDRGFGPSTMTAGMTSGVPVIDLTKLSAALYTSLGFCPNPGRFTDEPTPVGKFFCDDHTHFEAAGASQVAGVVAQALRDQNIALAAYLK